MLSTIKSQIPSGFLRFAIRFSIALLALLTVYKFYLWFTEQKEDLDWITYQVSFLSHRFALALGIADCEFSCFMDGCRIGVEGKMINVLEGCNGIKLAFVYIAYLIGVNENNRSTIIQSLIGLVLIQLFNVFRIGMLVMLIYHGGDMYFFFIKYIFGVFIYGSIIVLWLLKPVVDRYLNRHV